MRQNCVLAVIASLDQVIKLLKRVVKTTDLVTDYLLGPSKNTLSIVNKGCLILKTRDIFFFQNISSTDLEALSVIFQGFESSLSILRILVVFIQHFLKNQLVIPFGPSLINHIECKKCCRETLE